MRTSSRLDPSLWHDILLGPVVSLVRILAGDTPLHGCCLHLGGGAIGFLGAPGAGKSTIAAAGVAQGAALVTDDLMAIEWRRGAPHVLPGYPEIRLWPASGRRLVPDFDALPLVVPTASKRRLDPRDLPGGFADGPMPLRAIYALQRSPLVRRPVSERLAPRDAFLTLMRNLYDSTFTRPDIQAQHFRAAARLSRRVPVRRLRMPARVGALPAALRALPELIRHDLGRNAP